MARDSMGSGSQNTSRPSFPKTKSGLRDLPGVAVRIREVPRVPAPVRPRRRAEKAAADFAAFRVPARFASLRECALVGERCGSRGDSQLPRQSVRRSAADADPARVHAVQMMSSAGGGHVLLLVPATL